MDNKLYYIRNASITIGIGFSSKYVKCQNKYSAKHGNSYVDFQSSFGNYTKTAQRSQLLNTDKRSGGIIFRIFVWFYCEHCAVLV